MMTSRPPDMRQTSLVKNPASVRRDSLRSECAGADDSSEDDRIVFSFIFDASAPGTLTVHLFATEVEDPPGSGLIRLVQQQGDEDTPVAPLMLDTRSFEAGMEQEYRSPILDLGQWPEERLAASMDRP